MAERFYCGSAKARDTQYGEQLTVSVDLTECTRLFADYGYITKDGKKHYITLKINRRREVGKYGETHTVEVDTWKPEQKQTPPQSKPETEIHAQTGETVHRDFPDDIPF